jgi:hypothetical protein
MSEKQPKRGRPKKYEVDLEIVEKMAGYGCTFPEIADILQIPERTVRRQGAEAYQKGKAMMKYKLRKAQLHSALDGNVTAQIWLGKQLLNQTENGTFEEDDLLSDVSFDLDDGTE